MGLHVSTYPDHPIRSDCSGLSFMSWLQMNILRSPTLWSVLMVLAICMSFSAIPASLAVADSAPFAPGERLEFQLRWTMIPAGKAVMEVMPMKTIGGTKVYHFRLTAKSNSFVDMFYKVRDRIDAYAVADMTQSVRYRKKQHEGKRRRNVRVDFDWNKEMASYRDGKKHRQVELMPGTFDPLSAFYKTRMADFKKDGLIEYPVSDGKKCVTGLARIVKKETITTPSGTYETYLLEPDMKDVGGVFEKEKGAKIKLWVTADERRLPVKIASKVAVGSFVGELIAINKTNS